MAKEKWIAGGLALVIGFGGICAALSGCSADTPEAETESPSIVEETSAEATEDDGEFAWTITQDGKTYRYNSRLRSVLFLGVDTEGKATASEIVGSGGRSDTMILFIVNSDDETLRMMPISRDTITSVDIYNSDQEFLFTGKMQLTMQYAFGNNASRSSQLTKRKVSEVLHNLPISGYFTLTLDGIKAAVEHVGGITLTLEEDWTDIDPEYVAGATITMDGDEVEHFLRYRDIETLGSNNTRMARHSWFISKMLSQLGSFGGLGIEQMLEFLDPYLETDVDAETVKKLATYNLDPEAIEIPGENVAGENHDEFYIDDDALQEVLLEAFYTETE